MAPISQLMPATRTSTCRLQSCGRAHYLAIEDTQPEINMPAPIMWARGLDDGPAVLTFSQPSGMRWHVATQLHGLANPFEFTAPNLQYLMDSPAEFGPGSIRQFNVESRTFRVAVHHTGTDAE